MTSEVAVERYASLRALFGALAPVAVVPADGSPTVACPGRDLMVSVGDRVTVLGTPEELEAADLVPKAPTDDAGSELPAPPPGPGRCPAPGPVGGRLGRQQRPARSPWWPPPPWSSLSTVILRLAYRLPGGGHMTVLTALYFTVETISTVGFGDFSFSHQSTGHR